jgi:hypothetical protein
MLPLPGLVQAAQWQSSVVVPTTVEYDSNPLLLTSDEKGVMRTLIEPTYNLVGTFDRDQLTLGLGVHVLHASDTSVQQNREDPDLSLGWRRDTEKGHFGLRAQYLESSTLSGTVLDTGVVTSTDGTQKMSILSGDFSHALSARTTFDNETRYSHATYDVATLTGYDEWANTSTLTYAWNERTDLFSGLRLRRYEPDQSDTAVASNSYTPTVGLQYQISDRLTGRAHVGVSQVSGSSGRRGEGGVLLDYRGIRHTASFSAERTTVASAQGGFAQLDLVHGMWSYAVDELTRVGLDAQWQDSKGQSPNTLQTYSAWASREFSPAWDLRLSLMYKERQQSGVPDAAATIVGLTLTYRYPDL